MNTYQIQDTDLRVSRLGYGCMNLGGRWDSTPLAETDHSKAARLVAAAVEQGVTLFDHADIYTLGKSEAVFGSVLKESPGLRPRLVLVSKCGIRLAGDTQPGDPKRYDFSNPHIVRAVEGSLRRLRTDYLDILLLHRPDPLVEPDEVARAFDNLLRDGKVRYFGVSNHTASQIALLQHSVTQRLVVNQVELSLIHASLIDDGIRANQEDTGHAGADGTLDYCRLHGILIQAYAPVAKGGLIDPPPNSDERTVTAARVVARIAEAKGTTREAVALAWLLRHPGPIQPIIGTTNLERLTASMQADRVELSREEWYTLFVAARGGAVP
jgi:predicted oxidoreductase